MDVSLIIPAAGIGKRFSQDKKKQFVDIDGKPLIYWTIKRLIEAYNFTELIIGANEDDIEYIKEIILKLNISIPVIYVKGGKERANTVLNCIKKSHFDFVAVHDSVRPFASDKTIITTIQNAFENNACICVLPVRDTLKKCDNNIISNTLSRDNLFLAHTPQVFKKDIIEKALETAINNDNIVTDEASACELEQIPVYTVLSNYENIKITYYEDMDIINLYKKKFFK